MFKYQVILGQIYECNNTFIRITEYLVQLIRRVEL